MGAAVFSEKGLVGIVLPYESKLELEQEIARRFGEQTYNKNLGKPLCSSLARYFLGDVVQFNIQVDYGNATDFEILIYSNLRAIPYGETLSYKKLAELSGRPRAARAVGNALAKNPLPIVVPCHRVIRSDGSIGGWSGKREWKEKLLKIEGVAPTALGGRPSVVNFQR